LIIPYSGTRLLPLKFTGLQLLGGNCLSSHVRRLRRDVDVSVYSQKCSNPPSASLTGKNVGGIAQIYAELRKDGDKALMRAFACVAKQSGLVLNAV
jgi:hypothetical protein